MSKMSICQVSTGDFPYMQNDLFFSLDWPPRFHTKIWWILIRIEIVKLAVSIRWVWPTKRKDLRQLKEKDRLQSRPHCQWERQRNMVWERNAAIGWPSLLTRTTHLSSLFSPQRGLSGEIIGHLVIVPVQVLKGWISSRLIFQTTRLVCLLVLESRSLRKKGSESNSWLVLIRPFWSASTTSRRKSPSRWSLVTSLEMYMIKILYPLRFSMRCMKKRSPSKRWTTSWCFGDTRLQSRNSPGLPR